MATPSPQPLLLAIGYTAAFARLFERWHRRAADFHTYKDALFIRFAVAIIVFVGMVFHYAAVQRGPGYAYYTGIFFETIPGIVGVILLVIVVIDYILEKEGFVTVGDES